MIQEIGKNRYRLVVSVGGRGSRRRFTRTVECAGKREAKRLYAEFEAEVASGKAEGEDGMAGVTACALVEEYIAHMGTMNRRRTTIRGYETCLKRLRPLLGKAAAKDCTPYKLQRAVSEMSAAGLSAKTIKNTMGLLSAAYARAVKMDLLESNPCDRVDLPSGRPREARILHADELPLFCAAIAEAGADERVAYGLALFMGLRRSELLGLRESDVDVARGLLNVHSTRHRVNGEDYESGTKTRRSTRVLAVPDSLLLEIAKLIQAHSELPCERTDYLVQDGFGQPLSAQALSSRLERLEECNGLPHVTLHGLRHTYASLLHARGVDMANISAELGHSNLTTTQNIYTHIFQDATNASRGIARTVDAFLAEGSAPPEAKTPSLPDMGEAKTPSHLDAEGGENPLAP